MIVDDHLLLSRYAASRDAGAFAALVERYSGMVYAVASRVTGNAATAEDIAQDCFLTLALQATTIRGSLPAWLHRVALNRSLRVIRTSTARRQREDIASEISKSPHDVTWNEMMPAVDAAIAQLPDDLRELLIQHFLVGRTQAQLAQSLGVSQGTVSRRLGESVEMVRGNLKNSGLVCAAAVLSAGLAQSASAAVPATLATSLSKMAIAGPAKAAASGGIATFIAANLKLIGAITAAIMVTATLTYELASRHKPSTTTVSTRPYLSKLELKGDGIAQDSFSLAFVALARLYGRDADYETVYALSTNAFCPVITLSHRSRSYWHVQAWLGDRNIETLGARYGLKVRHLDMRNAPNDKDEYRQALAPILSSEMDAGDIILVCAGWREDTDVIPWAGIVTDVRSNGRITGVSTNGRTNNDLDRPDGIWAIAPGTVSMNSHVADIATLRAAVDRIGGRGEFQTTPEYCYGLQAMDVWMKAMSETPGFCPCESCQASLHQASRLPEEAAYANALTARTASEVAARYLRRIAGDFPADAQSHLESGATHYDRIVSLLSPTMEEASPDSYVAILGDLARQRDHVVKVLAAVKSEYAAIAQDLEQAVNAK